MPWALGPADGRYVLRDERASAISHVILLTTLGAPRPVRTSRFARTRPADGEPGAVPVTVARATVIAAASPLPDARAADAWLRRAGEPELQSALTALTRLLHAHRLATADPAPVEVRRHRLIAARAGYGDGDAVAAGRFAQARELLAASRSPRGARRRGSLAEARLAALLSGRQAPLACEELVLRARLDLDDERPREAALQLLVALDAALAELPGDPEAAALATRIAQLRESRPAVAAAAQEALAGLPSAAARASIAEAVDRLQAALRARAAGGR